MFDICLINEPISENCEQTSHILCGKTWNTVTYTGKVLYLLNRYLISTLWNHKMLELEGVLETIQENPLISTDNDHEWVFEVLKLVSDRAMNYNSELLIPFLVI